MYIPASFRVEDRATLLGFVERYGFATLVSVRDGVPFATHLPLLLDRAEDRLLGHVARANPHWECFAGDGETLAIFSGPHAYVSPSWYRTAPAVPTWNYAVVHVWGRPTVLGPEETGEVVDRLVAQYEGPRPDPWPNVLPEEFRRRMIAGIVGFAMPIARIEGKFKLGQNRPDADQAGMKEGLRRDGLEAGLLADFIEKVDPR